MFLPCHTHVYSDSALRNYLNVKELLAQNRCDIWNLSDFNVSGTQNHLARKRTLNRQWLSVCLQAKRLRVRVPLNSVFSGHQHFFLARIFHYFIAFRCNSHWLDNSWLDMWSKFCPTKLCPIRYLKKLMKRWYYGRIQVTSYRLWVESLKPRVKM